MSSRVSARGAVKGIHFFDFLPSRFQDANDSKDSKTPTTNIPLAHSIVDEQSRPELLKENKKHCGERAP
jgi:hypothetical protein